MSGDVFKELEELRRLLDAPLPQCSSNGKDHEIHQKLADQPLHSQVNSALVDFSGLILGAEVLSCLVSEGQIFVKAARCPGMLIA
jgi:hypothetical protein